jgi:hypothetical protein
MWAPLGASGGAAGGGADENSTENSTEKFFASKISYTTRQRDARKIEGAASRQLSSCRVLSSKPEQKELVGKLFASGRGAI